MSVIAFSSSIGPVPINCTISENHDTGIEITGNPIETGSEINDHAYIMPKSVTLEIGDESAALTYNALVRFQESRIPFNLVTGLSIYPNMLIKSISAERDSTFSKVLKATVHCQEVIIVSTSSSSGQGSGLSPSGSAGGDNSRTSIRPSQHSANNDNTAKRAAQVVQRGDSPFSRVSEDLSSKIIAEVFN